MFNDPGLITLTAVTLLAAVVNGGLGYGFSSITVPVALIFYANRILNPALVLVEVALNGYLRPRRNQASPVARHKDELEAVLNFVDTIFYSDTGHWLAPALEGILS